MASIRSSQQRRVTGGAAITALPNLLTYARILAVPAMVAAYLYLDGDLAHWVALAIFVGAAVTDFFDGLIARVYASQSALGTMLDPIADKLIVAAALLILVYDNTLAGAAIWAALIILSREILVSGLREFLAELSVRVPVTWLAKWKTTMQMIAIGFLLAGPAGDQFMADLTGFAGVVSSLGGVLLWLSALLTLYTGYDYFRAGLRHVIERE